MFRKEIILYSLLTLTLLNAESTESAIGINVGMNSTKNETGSKFQNPTIGITYQDDSYVVIPRVDVEYVKLKDEEANSLLKGSFNGVYKFENRTNTTPYAIAGVGYESVNGSTKDVFESHPFVQGGAGLSIDILKDYRLNVEGKFLQILGGNNEENEVVATVGISIPLGTKKVVPPKVVEPKILLPILISEKEVIPEPIKRENPDLDEDGVENRFDQCPSTPPHFTVDKYGCSIKATLHINFETNSARIKNYSLSKVDNFAQFLLKNKGTVVKIVGYTDSRGSTDDNYLLSKRRASSVATALIERGVSSSRIKSEGRGESMPIASNKTAEGRAENRRIEVEISYPKGRK
jgi:OOP family OmpA-OmpF porin